MSRRHNAHPLANLRGLFRRGRSAIAKREQMSPQHVLARGAHLLCGNIFVPEYRLPLARIALGLLRSLP